MRALSIPRIHRLGDLGPLMLRLTAGVVVFLLGLGAYSVDRVIGIESQNGKVPS